MGFNKWAAVSSAGKGGLPLQVSTCSLSLESGIQVVELVWAVSTVRVFKNTLIAAIGSQNPVG